VRETIARRQASAVETPTVQSKDTRVQTKTETLAETRSGVDGHRVRYGHGVGPIYGDWHGLFNLDRYGLRYRYGYGPVDGYSYGLWYWHRDWSLDEHGVRLSSQSSE
jgi:hypothetical protein